MQAHADALRRRFRTYSQTAGGSWGMYVTQRREGHLDVVVDERSDLPVEAMSVNKVAVAIAVMTLVDDDRLSLNQPVDIGEDIVIHDGDGLIHLTDAYPTSISVAHVLALLLTVSDDTAVRLCGTLIEADMINSIIAGHGYPGTRVSPGDRPDRFYLGVTTPREAHDLFLRLALGEILSHSSTRYLLRLLRSPLAFNEGIRRELATSERTRVATKAGWLGRFRHEVGVVFDVDQSPGLTYSLFTTCDQRSDDFTATHPAVHARARLGRALLGAVDAVDAAVAESDD